MSPADKLVAQRSLLEFCLNIRNPKESPSPSSHGGMRALIILVTSWDPLFRNLAVNDYDKPPKPALLVPQYSTRATRGSKIQSCIIQVTCLLKNFHWGERKKLLPAIKMLLIAYSLRDISGTFSSISLFFPTGIWSGSLLISGWGEQDQLEDISYPSLQLSSKARALPWGGRKKKAKRSFWLAGSCYNPLPFFSYDCFSY